MSSPFAFSSPRIPAAPQSTPITSSNSYFLNRPRPPRPPVVNPYDKFSQAEFDDWISKITGSLRKALGHEADEPERMIVDSASASAMFDKLPRGIHAYQTHPTSSDEEQEEYETDEEGVNDSLADIRARFTARLDKGKARDPMEGPGFKLPISGKGNKDEPIEIDLDEDKGEYTVDESLQGVDASVDLDALDDEEVAMHLSFIRHSDDEEGEGEPEQWFLSKSLIQNEGNPKKRREDEYDDESDEGEGSSLSEEIQDSDNAIEILLSDDEAVTREPVRALPFIGKEEHSSSEAEGEDIELAVQENRVEEESLSSEQESLREPVYKIGTALSGAEEEFEEDIGEEGADDDIEEEKEDTGDEQESSEEEGAEIEEEDEDEGSEGEEEHDQPQPFSMRRKLSPEIIDLDSDAEEDQLNGNSDDIRPQDPSFPPHHDDLQTPIEIRNPWLGPQTYAEDYYAGGPILSPQGLDVLCNPHILGSNDDREGFLAPEAITLAESNEREASAGVRQPTLPCLPFDHSHSTETWSEMLPETDFAAGAVTTVELQNAEEVNNISIRGSGLSKPMIIETRDESNMLNADLAQEKGLLGSQEQLDHNILFETIIQRVLPSQETVQDGENEAVHQAEATYDNADAEVAHRSQSHLQLEEASKVSLPLHRKVLSVTVEDATDEEAENVYLREGEDTWISPLGTSDLSIEVAASNSRLVIPADDVPSRPDTERAIGDEEAKDSILTAPEVLVEIADNGDSQTLSNVVEVVTSEPVQSHFSTVEALESGEQIDQLQLSPLLPSSLPATDVVDTTIESEPEQQQLPTPPAEQEDLHHAPTRHNSPETQPETLVAEDEALIASITAGKAVSQQDLEATFIEQSPMTSPISSKDIPGTSAGGNEQEIANIPANITVAVKEKVFETLDYDEEMLDQQFIAQTETNLSDTDMSPPLATLRSDVAIQDITEDAITMEVNDHLVVVEEIPSKAASEEPESVDKYTFKESSVISLPFSDGVGVSPGPSYLVEELPDDEVTDEDADGEVDPDLGTTSSSRRWNDLADDIFDANLRNLGESFFSPVPSIDAVEAGMDQSRVTFKEGSAVSITEQIEPVAVQENRSKSQLTLMGEKSTVFTKPESSLGDPAEDEDDIASSREMSPVVEYSSKSPSPVTSVSHLVEGFQTESLQVQKMKASKEKLGPLHPATLSAMGSLASAVPQPQSSPSGSEKELYGDKGGSTEGQTQQVGLAYETSPFTEDLTPDVGADDVSTTIPGLTLTTSLRPTSPIPGLGARLLEDAGTEAVDGEIPGLTWSKTFPSLINTKECSMPPRPASCLASPSHSPLSLKQAQDWLMTHVPYAVARRATEPVLFSDPYPYSLSTPGLDSAKDEVGDTEDEEEQDMSMSSSSTSISAEKDSERDVGEPNLETDENIERKLFVAASPAGENKPEESEPGSTQDSIQTTVSIDGLLMNFNDADQDRDADGDLDPDFVVLPDTIPGPNEKSTTVENSNETPSDIVLQETANVFSDARKDTLYIPSKSATERQSELLSSPDSPDILKDTAAAFVPNVTKETVALILTPESLDLDTNTQTDKNRSMSLEAPVAEELHQNATRSKEVQDVAIYSSPQSSSPLPQAEEINGPSKRTSNGKRKRSLTPHPKVAAQAIISDEPNNAIKSQPAQSTRLQFSQRPDRTKRPRTTTTMNGKPEHGDSEDSDVSSELTAPSDDDASIVGNELLRGGRAESSRTITALSPSTENNVEHFYPMLHRHGRGAKNQSKEEQILSYQRSIQRTQSAPFGSRASHSHLDPSRIPFASQRATRSNCRYRKISVPREEDGPRVCFLVPGCSLGDEEVIEDNEIEDLGEASYADSLRMVRDIESLFDSYLIGVLRQLVGVDLLREQEVFYLPAPGEEPVIRKLLSKKSLSDKSSLNKRPSRPGNVDTGSVLSTPSRSAISTSFRSPSLSKAPVSHSSATSTAISNARRGSRYERDSFTPASSLSLSSSDEEKRSDDDEQRRKHRSNYNHKAEKVNHSEQSTKGGKISKRRLTSDAMAYKPQSDSDDDSSTDNSRFSRKISVTSLKRTRSGKSFVISGEADGREAKKIKRDR